MSTGGYQSQANPVERWHRYVNSAMTMLSEEFGQDWNHYLQVVVCNYNVSVCESTGYSPYKLLFGRNQSVLQDLPDDDPKAPSESMPRGSVDCKKMAGEMAKTLKKSYEHVIQNQKAAATRIENVARH